MWLIAVKPNPIDLTTDAEHPERSCIPTCTCQTFARTLLRVTGTVYHREHWQDHSSMLSLTEQFSTHQLASMFFTYLLSLGKGCIPSIPLPLLNMSRKFIFQRLPIHPLNNWASRTTTSWTRRSWVKVLMDLYAKRPTSPPRCCC